MGREGKKREEGKEGMTGTGKVKATKGSHWKMGRRENE